MFDTKVIGVAEHTLEESQNFSLLNALVILGCSLVEVLVEHSPANPPLRTVRHHAKIKRPRRPGPGKDAV